MPLLSAQIWNSCIRVAFIENCSISGWPKTKKVLAPLPDEVIERKIKKEKEGKKGGKGDKAKGKENAKSEADKSKTKKTKS